MKKNFKIENNSAYPKQTGIVNIIGKSPQDQPYLSITIQEEGSQIAHGWIPDKDLERLAVNILKALKSKRLNPNPIQS